VKTLGKNGDSRRGGASGVPGRAGGHVPAGEGYELVIGSLVALPEAAATLAGGQTASLAVLGAGRSGAPVAVDQAEPVTVDLADLARRVEALRRTATIRAACGDVLSCGSVALRFCTLEAFVAGELERAGLDRKLTADDLALIASERVRAAG